MSAQPVQPMIDGVVRGFDQSVGVEQKRGLGWQDGDCVGARSGDSGAEEYAVSLVEVAGLTVVGNEQGRRVAGVRPRQAPQCVVAECEPGEDHGGHGYLGYVHHCLVELSDDGAGCGLRMGPGEGAQHVADLRHAGCGVEVVPDDVADDQCVGVDGQSEGVVPVTAHG